MRQKSAQRQKPAKQKQKQEPAKQQKPAKQQQKAKPPKALRTRHRPVTARPVQLSSTRYRGGGTVITERVPLDLSRDSVVISRSRAVQIGDHNRQLNTYRFMMVRPTFAVERLLGENPAARRALVRLAENPRSWFAGYAFQRTLHDGPLWTGGRIRLRQMPGRGATRVRVRTAEPDGAGPIVVERSQGVQLVDHATQRNHFRYEVIDPELSAEAALRGQPQLARTLATAIRHPAAGAAQRAFGRQLEKLYARSGGQVRDRTVPSAGLAWKLVMSDGVQLGTANVRADKAQVHTRQITVVGWAKARAPERATRWPSWRGSLRRALRRSRQGRG